MTTSNKINSIARAAEILKHLSNGVSKLTEISRRLEVNKASVHRIMKTLEDKGLVSQDPSTRGYYLGPLIQTLAENPIMVHKILSQLARPEMERLRDLIGETAILQIRLGGQRLIIEVASSNRAIRYFPENRHTAPVHAGAGCKMLLAGLNTAELTSLLNRIELVKIGPNTITDKKQLLSEIKEIQSKGYAISFGETVHGAAGIAVPVENYACPVALVIIGPEDRIRDNRDLILNELKASAEQISKKILTATGIKNGQTSSDI